MNLVLTKLSKLALVLILIALSASLLAQEVTVSGTVSDQAGTPLPGVNIVVEGSNLGTTTGVDGSFTITAPSADAALIFTYVGYKTQRIAVANQTSLNVQLEENVDQLADLVVVGYGVQEKGDVTGAISSVEGRDIQNIPVPGTSQALQGRVAGVQVVRNGGAPGERGRIRIRGTGTINDADPLVVIDGFPTSAAAIDDVNPNDIESIEVLKDASASAIYGTRAANGVIIITTKRGNFNQKTRFSLNAYTGISNAINTVDVLDASTLATLKREAYTNSGRDIPAIWDDPQYQVQRSDWQDELLGRGITQNIDFSLRGGGQSSSYAISGGYYNEEGMIKNAYYERFSLRINSDHQVNKRLKIGESIQLTRTEGNFLNTTSAQTGVYWSAIRFHPGLPVIDEDGNYGSSQVSGEFGDINNPIFTVDNEDDEQRSNRLLATLYAEVEIIEGLKFRANFGLDGTIADRDEFQIIVDEQIRANSRNTLNRRYDENYSLLMEYFLTYDKLFGDKHALNVVAGYTAQKFQGEYFATQRRDFSDESPDRRFLDAGSTITGSNGNRTEDGLVSGFARASYSFADRYLFTATFRADGSSRFAEGNRWGYFPAFSAGWRVSEESFWNVPLVSSLKLTAGWGQLGNQNVARNQFLALIQTGRRYSFGGEQAIGAAQSRIPNEEIGWEIAEILNFGAELGFWDNRLLANINYFIKDTEDMLLPVPVVGTIGRASVPDRNVGELRNQGVRTRSELPK
ncbi:MAG: SusC/RagA family TonB-linked outer membrane protein [Bacteroidia bacterium]|nr:SusC/RagA family TonB-linked outer membrane protein [Bacteroidia bacterium]